MSFKYNDSVEICKKGERFKGIYYRATIMAEMRRNKYLVRYETLFSPFGSLLIEAVDSDEVRPPPPPLSCHNFNVSDRVDAYANLAWRVGTVTRKVDNFVYVKLDCNGKEGHYAVYNVRRHLEWKNCTWLYHGSGSESNQASTSAQGGQPANDGNQANTEDQGGSLKIRINQMPDKEETSQEL